MTDFDHSRFRFWESAENLREYLSEISNRSISASLANQISNHLVQGRSYFESASRAPYEIRPVLLFYGMTGIAKALILAKRLNDKSTLPQKHGLKDISDVNARLDGLKLKVESAGTFQSFNNEARKRKVVLLKDSLWENYHCYSSPSENISNKVFNLQDILSRIPGLENLYKDTFKKEANTVRCSWPGHNQYSNYVGFETYEYKSFKSLQEINIVAREISENYPFLKKWLLIKANWSHNRHELEWANIKFDSDNWISGEHFTNDDLLGKVENGFVAKDKIYDEEREDFKEIIPPMESGHNQIHGGPYVIKNFDGLDLSEASLYFLGMFLLSSLVRYRPDTWIHSLKGRHTDMRPIDDKSLAIILRFMELSLKVFPDLIIDLIKEPPGQN